MSFWSSLFGGSKTAKESKAGESVEYNGFVIRAEPFQDGGKWLTAGSISKDVGGEARTHRFVRADSHASFDQAAAFSLDKGRQIVDLMGEKVFGER